MKHEINNIDFGSWLRSKRKEKHLTQFQLANRSQIYEQYIGMIERGDKTPYLDAAERIIEALGCELVIRENNDRTDA